MFAQSVERLKLGSTRRGHDHLTCIGVPCHGDPCHVVDVVLGLRLDDIDLRMRSVAALYFICAEVRKVVCPTWWAPQYMKWRETVNIETYLG